MTLGEKLRKLRIERNLTQGELGIQVGTDGRNVSKYENDKIKPRKTTLERFANIFEVELDYLIDDIDSTNMPSKRLKNSKILSRFEQLEKMPLEDQEAILRVIDGLIIKNQLEGILNVS